MEETEQIQMESEAECQTRIWRLDQFIGSCFHYLSAAEMADDTQVDLGQARRLVALGCPLKTATRILR